MWASVQRDDAIAVFGMAFFDFSYHTPLISMSPQQKPHRTRFSHLSCCCDKISRSFQGDEDAHHRKEGEVDKLGTGQAAVTVSKERQMLVFGLIFSCVSSLGPQPTFRTGLPTSINLDT